MNILFLDVDGVLNNSVTELTFDPYNLDNLRNLCEALKPDIILSSDWRRRGDTIARVRSELNFWRLDISDITPVIMSPTTRKLEIKQWLNDNSDTWSKALILDDLDPEHADPEMDNVTFYQTDSRFGLMKSDVDEIMEIMQ